MKLDELPADVLCYITEYFEIGYALNKLINSHKFFRNIPQIREKYLYYLNNTQSLKYYNMLYGLAEQPPWAENLKRCKLSLSCWYHHQITDVSALGNVHILELSHCRNITDVSALGNMHNLSLTYCQNISDVSALGNVHTLTLTGCANITDVSALKNVHTLYLSYCRNITDVSALGNVHRLSLLGCYNIMDVSALGNVHDLNLSYCNNVRDVSALGNVHVLNLSCLLYTSPSPRDGLLSRMPSSA